MKKQSSITVALAVGALAITGISAPAAHASAPAAHSSAVAHHGAFVVGAHVEITRLDEVVAPTSKGCTIVTRPMTWTDVQTGQAGATTTATVFACTGMHPTRAQVAAALGSGALAQPARVRALGSGARVTPMRAAPTSALRPHVTGTVRATYPTVCGSGQRMYIEWDITAADQTLALATIQDGQGNQQQGSQAGSFGPGVHVFGVGVQPPSGWHTTQTAFADTANSYIYDYNYCQ